MKQQHVTTVFQVQWEIRHFSGFLSSTLGHLPMTLNTLSIVLCFSGIIKITSWRQTKMPSVAPCWETNRVSVFFCLHSYVWVDSSFYQDDRTRVAPRARWWTLGSDRTPGSDWTLESWEGKHWMGPNQEKKVKDQRKNEPQNMASQSALDILNWYEPGAATLPALKPNHSHHSVSPTRGPIVEGAWWGLPAGDLGAMLAPEAAWCLCVYYRGANHQRPPPEDQAHCLKNVQRMQQAA